MSQQGSADYGEGRKEGAFPAQRTALPGPEVATAFSWVFSVLHGDLTEKPVMTARVRHRVQVFSLQCGDPVPLLLCRFYRQWRPGLEPAWGVLNEQGFGRASLLGCVSVAFWAQSSALSHVSFWGKRLHLAYWQVSRAHHRCSVGVLW